MRKRKLPGQSWTIKEKLDLVNALCADRRFTHGEARAAVTMVLYFHNTANGHLFPSRSQVSEQCGVNRDVVISATRKMKRFGFLHYEQSSGGRNERNTYHLKKLAPKVVELHPETVGKSDSIESETVMTGLNPTRGSPEIRHAYTLGITSCEEGREPLPLPCNSRASGSLEKKKDASSGAQVVKLPNTQPRSQPMKAMLQSLTRRGQRTPQS